jgi:hypothetical protein
MKSDRYFNSFYSENIPPPYQALTVEMPDITPVISTACGLKSVEEQYILKDSYRCARSSAG